MLVRSEVSVSVAVQHSYSHGLFQRYDRLELSPMMNRAVDAEKDENGNKENDLKDNKELEEGLTV